jgi:hypothetical protein
MGKFVDDADQWGEFKKLLSLEDKDRMERILKKARINAGTRVDLNTALTKQEKTWTTNFAWHAFFWGFC